MLTVQRYGLSTDLVTFTKPIERDVYLSYIAHSLILGPNSREEALCGQSKYPLCVDHISEYYLDDVSDWHNEEFFSEGLLEMVRDADRNGSA